MTYSEEEWESWDLRERVKQINERRKRKRKRKRENKTMYFLMMLQCHDRQVQGGDADWQGQQVFASNDSTSIYTYLENTCVNLLNTRDFCPFASEFNEFEQIWEKYI